MDETKNKNEGNVGAIIGAGIVIVILLAGSFYFYGQRVEKQKQFEAMKNSIEQTATATDDIDSLLKEASSTNFDNLGEGIDNL
jgi:hypothetical protein